jgi:hypothetical protein
MNNDLFNFTPEMQLLLACCGLSMKQHDQDRKESLERLSALTCQESIDWEGFLNLIDRHRIHSIAYYNINQYATEHIPADVRLALRDHSAQKIRQMLNLTAELVRLSKLFAQHDIFMLSFKGPLLSQQLFGDYGLRYSKDLDLLVKPEELDQAEQLLLSNGYQRQQPDFALTPRQKKALFKMSPHVSFYNHKRQVLVELHWRLHANPHLLPSAYRKQMMANTQQLSIAGTQITSLSDEDTFLYLCLHGATHEWSRLKWLCDVAQFLHREQDINWPAWVEHVLALGLHRPIAQALLLAHQLFDAPLPPATSILTAEDQIVPQLMAHSIRVLMQSEEELLAVGQLNAFRHLPYRMKLKADLRYQWSDFSRIWLSVSANDWKRYPLPDLLFPLYYVLGPFSWLRRKYLMTTNRAGPQ